MAKDRVLIVDDDPGIRTQLKWALNKDYRLSFAESASEALKLAEEEKPDLIALDIALSSIEGAKDGLDILEDLLQIDPYIKIIMITGHDEKQNAAFGYLTSEIE